MSRTIDKTELARALRCPFCSEPDVTLYARRGYMLVGCTRRGCWAEGPRASRYDLLGTERDYATVAAEAVDRWNARTTVDAVRHQLDGKVWGPHTLDDIANLLRNAGYKIREPRE